jgi:hypothetical protein
MGRMTDLHRERGCARSPLLTFWGIVAPVAMIVAAAAGIGINVWPVYVGGFVAALGCLIYPTNMLVRNWPSSIAVNSQGLSIGDTGRRPRSSVAPTTQAQGRFQVDWPEVVRVDVVEGKAGLAGLWTLFGAVGRVKPAKLRRGPYTAGQGVTYVEGLLVVWGMRAALVITLRDPDVGERPAYRSVRGQGHVRRAVWAAPTRRPEALRTALAQSGHPAGATLGAL